MGVVWTVQPFWSHHPRYPLPEVRVAALCVDGDFRVEACSASAVHSTQTSASLYPYQHYAHLHCPIHFRLPTLSSTMHHTSSQKGLRSGWQSGASEPHLLTRRCSNRRKLCGPSAPIAYATSGSSSAKPNYLISRLNGWSSLSFGIRFACWLPSCPNGSCMQLSIGN